MDPMSMTDEIGKILSLLSIQYMVGRKASFPFGLFIQFSLIKIFILIAISDIFLTLFLMSGLEVVFKKCKPLRKIKLKIMKKLEKRKENNKILKKFKKIAPLCLFIVAANPFVGGSFWGSIYAHSIQIRKSKAFFIINLGGIICTLIYCIIVKGATTIL